jgi:hypothetical protein
MPLLPETNLSDRGGHAHPPGTPDDHVHEHAGGIADIWARTLDNLTSPHAYCLAGDPTLVFWSDLANLGVGTAYCLGFPFVATLVFSSLNRTSWPALLTWCYWLGVGSSTRAA